MSQVIHFSHSFPLFCHCCCFMVIASFFVSGFQSCTVADSGFHRGRGPNCKGGDAHLLIGQFFLMFENERNWAERKELVPGALPESTNAVCGNIRKGIHSFISSIYLKVVYPIPKFLEIDTVIGYLI